VGMALTVIGGLFALSERSIARSVAYVVVGDLGVTLLAVSLNSPVGYKLALGLSGVRVVSLGVWGLGVAVLERKGGGHGRGSFSGSGRQSPVAAAGALVGLASLSGLPMTAGFPARWGVMAAFAGQAPGVALLVIASIILNGLACIKWLREALAPQETQSQARTTRWESAFLGTGIAVCLALGLFPQLVFPWVIQTLGGLRNLLL
jgi:NADH-quinone oxidoreductase subunit N